MERNSRIHSWGPPELFDRLLSPQSYYDLYGVCQASLEPTQKYFTSGKRTRLPQKANRVLKCPFVKSKAGNLVCLVSIITRLRTDYKCLPTTVNNHVLLPSLLKNIYIWKSGFSIKAKINTDITDYLLSEFHSIETDGVSQQRKRNHILLLESFLQLFEGQ